MKEIFVAGGCFWGVQEFMSRLDGVISTEVGYANGRTDNPTYEDICNNNTYYAEVCKIIYNENKISLKDILKEFWSIINPTVLNKQGNDVGSQYRTGIYYTDKNDIEIIEDSKADEQKNYSKKIVTEIKPLEKYYKAEEYHQDYLKKNPGGYCHIKLD
ncbi:peptide-methionine (S)-S-oxide reductase MsrA [Clostridium sp.]|uniref:peptide-methionine (S)-S-oxide reductase MsrA n=1 Tax=Clostridium sp. TaxID=1506 RepID=UPI002FCBD049